MSDLTRILRIDASGRMTNSVTRGLTDLAIDHLSSNGQVQVVSRDLKDGLPFVDEAWIGANFTPADQRSPAQITKLGLSDTIVSEVKHADLLLIGLPVYNFGVPAAFKAWIDMVARVGQTFRYTENGPVGLLEGKRAVMLIASGGTKIGSEIDFVTPYIRHVLGFIGITDVTFIAADALGSEAEEKLKAAQESVRALAA